MDNFDLKEYKRQISPRCFCEESGKLIHERKWIVVQRKCNYSAFNGYHYAYSDYSLIHCKTCGKFWRTKASYVNQLKDDEE